ncbi:MAG: HAD hydrolase-like protein [Candidatus Babeliales bacterium]|nr:HAD hydrolase-like protein [Candidatus Babeliales bacterium]
MNSLFKIIISLVICYFAYRLYQQKQLNDKIKAINDNAYNQIHVTPETVFVFDIDGVILKPDFKKMFDIVCNAPKLKLFSILIHPRLIYHIYSLRDDETTEEVLNKILNFDPKFKSCIDIAYKLTYTKKEFPKTCALIKELRKKNYKLLILSNETTNGMKVLTKEHPIFNLFDDMFLTTTNDNYIKKPNPEFYKKFITWIEGKNIDPKNLIFIDDRIKNVIIANKMGIPSIVFTNINELNKILFK